jgi:hypothetical protein
VGLVFVLGAAFGAGGVLGARRVLGERSRTEGSVQLQSGQQVSALIHEMGLTSVQEQQFRQILADTRVRYNAIRDAMEPRFEQVRRQNRERFRQVLTTGQAPLFEDFLRESRNRRNDTGSNRRNEASLRSDGAAFNSDLNGNRNGQPSLVARLTEHLHLTSEQESQLQSILGDTRASFDVLRQEMNSQFEETRLQNRDRLRQLLTDEQRPSLEAFFQRRDEVRGSRQ